MQFNKFAKAVLATAAIFLFGVDTMAQKMITFDDHPSSSPASRSKKSRKKDDGKNALAIGIGSALNGYMPLYYERAIGQSFTLQAGAGITFRSYLNDLAMIMVYEDGVSSDYFDNYGVTDIDDNYASYKYR